MKFTNNVILVILSICFVLFSYLFFLLVFTKDFPARSTFQVGKLPAGATVEIEAIAACGDVSTEVLDLSSKM